MPEDNINNKVFTAGEKAYIELAAERAADKAVEKAKTEWTKDIKLHKLQCDVGKFKVGFGLVCSIIGGTIVALFSWFLRK